MKVDPVAGGAVPALSPAELVALAPELKSIADVSVFEFGRYPGPHMTPHLMLRLRDKILEIIHDEAPDGVVVTHGTDTLEESAYFLDLMLGVDIPVVVTGAMMNASQKDWDGAQNLCDSARVAINPAFRGLGVIVCLAGEVNAASEVSKTHTDEAGTFSSFDFGPLATIRNASITLLRQPHHRDTIAGKSIAERVPLVKCYAGMTERIFEHLLEEHIEGLVVEAMGVGNVPPPAFDGIAQIIKSGVPVVLVSRCPIGRPHDDYAYYGAGKNLKNLGVMFADYLNGQKARIKLLCALGKTHDHESIRKLFEWAE